MVTRKYTADYRLENELDPKTGRLVTRAVYRGDWFGFSAAPEAVAGLKKRDTVCGVLAALCFAAGLALNAPATRTMYVLLPFALLLFPLYYTLAGCRRLVTAKERVTREHRDKICDRLPASSLFLMILSALSAAGSVIRWAALGAVWRDLLLLLAAALIFVCGLLIFLRRGLLAMRKLPV